MARRNFCFLAVFRVEASGTPNFLPGDAFGKLPRIVRYPISGVFQRGTGGGEALRSS